MNAYAEAMAKKLGELARHSKEFYGMVEIPAWMVRLNEQMIEMQNARGFVDHPAYKQYLESIDR